MFYLGAKHALEGAMKCIRMEMRPWNVRVINVNPSYMKTPLITTSVDNLMKEYKNASQEIQMQYPVECIPKAAERVFQLQEVGGINLMISLNLIAWYICRIL
jgi:NAD(P)-dependent dehydrogenase (short-subunit alcohol dehydrogenase family)